MDFSEKKNMELQQVWVYSLWIQDDPSTVPSIRKWDWGIIYGGLSSVPSQTVAMDQNGFGWFPNVDIHKDETAIFWLSGWWFRRWIDVFPFHDDGMSSEPHWLSLHHFSRWAHGKPPSSILPAKHVSKTQKIFDLWPSSQGPRRLSVLDRDMTGIPGLVNIRKAMENDPWFKMIYLVIWMVIFHSFVGLLEGTWKWLEVGWFKHTLTLTLEPRPSFTSQMDFPRVWCCRPASAHCGFLFCSSGFCNDCI